MQVLNSAILTICIKLHILRFTNITLNMISITLVQNSQENYGEILKYMMDARTILCK